MFGLVLTLQKLKKNRDCFERINNRQQRCKQTDKMNEIWFQGFPAESLCFNT
jgi:hypothetical protein